MKFVPKLPHKVQHISTFSLSFVSALCEKTASEKFVGGRRGIDRELLFFLHLMKRLTNWSFRTVSEIGGISHSTLVRANSYFLLHRVYEKFFLFLVREPTKKGFIKGRFVAMDSSFVQTFSKKQEEGSEG